MNDSYGDSDPPKKRIRIVEFLTMEGTSSKEIWKEETMETKEKKKRKREKVHSICLVYQKQRNAISQLRKVYEENSWLPFADTEQQLRVFAFEWQEEVFPCLSENCTNFNEVFNNLAFRQSRYFLLCSYISFWPLYSSIPSKSKHFYEVILPDQPVNLYFDVEGPRKKDRRKENEVSRIFIKELQLELKRIFGPDVKIGAQGTIIDLTSTTEKKYSRHLIIKPIVENEKVGFRSSSDCDRFVKNWVLRLKTIVSEYFKGGGIGKRGKGGNSFNIDENYRKRIKEIGQLFFTEEDARTRKNLLKSIIDDCVYSKNRHFRVLFSSKCGKGVPFQMTEECLQNAEKRFSPVPIRASVIDNEMEKFCFLESQVMNVGRNNLNLGCEMEKCEYLQKMKSGNRKFVPATNIKIRTNYGNRSSSNGKKYEREFSGTQPENVTNLPGFVHLRLYLENELSKYGENRATVRAINYYPTTKKVIIMITGNRYCHRIRREHASNHVFYQLDLGSRMYFQKCTDPDCKRYSSPPFRVHNDVKIPV